MQPWSFLVIKNKDVMRRLSESGKSAMIPLLEHMFYNAPVLVIILGNKNALTVDVDCAMAAQNMMLAAHSKGIGSCWIGGVLPALMDESILKELGAPPDYKAVAPLIFGYPKDKTPAPQKIEPAVKWLK